MRIGVGLSIPELSTRGGRFSPASLFTAGTVGAWYDPSDYSTLFQDSAGTTPVTAVEQPVGLMLDKSQGLSTLGTQLVTNGDFSGPDLTNWQAASGGSYVISSGRLQVTGAGATNTGASYALSTVVGIAYSVSFAVTLGTATVVDSIMSLSASGGAAIGSSYQFMNVNGTFTYSFVATATTTYFQFLPRGAGNTAFLDNFSVKSLGSGNHASQATSTSRPVLRARYNLLTYSEQFDNAAWTAIAGNVTNSPNSTTAPDGTVTADLIYPTTTGSNRRIIRALVTTANTVYTQSIYIKSAGFQWVSIAAINAATAADSCWFDIVNGVKGTIGSDAIATSITPVTGAAGWFRITLTGTADGSNDYFLVVLADANGSSTATANGTSGVYIWGADLRTGSSAGTYQRIAAATVYDTAGFLPYLAFDGTDDSFGTNSINFSATNKMSVCAGVTKLSDAAPAIVAELSATSASNSGSFYVAAPEAIGANYFSSKMRGTFDPPPAIATSASFASPVTVVVSALGDIAADGNLLRLNGAQVASQTADQGAGNFGNYPLFIGRRNNASLPFNGRIYQMVVCGKTLSAAELASTEAYVNSKTGAY